MEPEVKPGYKTSEFWLTVAVVVVGFLMSSGAVVETGTFWKGLSFVATALAALGYTFNRAWVKNGGPG